MTAPVFTGIWTHQQQALEFLQQLWNQGYRGAMLAMAMGTGKSRVAIETARQLGARRVLIACPLRVVEVWRSQLDRFAPGHFVFLGLNDDAGGVRAKTTKARQMVAWARDRNQPLVIAINYESARIEPFARWSANQIWDLVIADEIHRIKEAAGRTSLYMSHLGMRAHRRLGLTGTPMPHQPIDIWGQFRFLDRSILDATFGAFKLRHAVMGGFGNKQVVEWKDLDQLYANFKKIAFQVDDSVLDLPEQLDETLTADLSTEGARIYTEMEEEMITWIRTQEGAGIEVTAANAMVRLLRLAQITGGSLPAADGSAVQVDFHKANLLDDFLSDLPEDEPVVVFCRFKPDLAAVHVVAQHHNRPSGELSGTRDDLAQWQRGDKRDPVILAVQIQAGGIGVDLTRARLAVYYSIGFSLADYLQSRARIRRPPQQRPCAFYHLTIRNSIDEYIKHAVEARSDLINSVLHELKQGARR